MQKIDRKTLFNGIRNDFKIAVDDLFDTIENLREEVEELKKEKSEKL